MAKVPFEFVLGNKVVPAGEWILRPAAMDGMILQIRTKDSEVNMLSPVILVDSKKAASHYTLLFHKYGEQYFLSEVRIAGTRVGYKLPEAKAEAEMRAHNVPATSEILLASRE